MIPRRIGIKYSSTCRRRISDLATPTTDFVCLKYAPEDFPTDSAVVYTHAINVEESNAFVNYIQSKLKRKRYQKGHWDGVISAYRELELIEISNGNDDDHDETATSDAILCRTAIMRIRMHLEKTYFFSNNNYHDNIPMKEWDRRTITDNQHTSKVQWLPCHAIDLRKDGLLSPHVDSVRFSGGIVAGLSLQSSSIMRLKPVNDDQLKDTCHHVDLFLPPLSLYVLSGLSRYKYTHELLNSGQMFHVQRNNELIQVDRQDRISIIFRDAPLSQPILLCSR